MKARIFVASSAEGARIGRAIQAELGTAVEVVMWNQNVFEPSSYVLEGLQQVLNDYDFGIFVFSPDDVLRLRKDEFSAVRDNVLFELGLFMSHLGRQRSFIVAPSDQRNLRIPTDLLGITYLTYDRNWENVQGAVATACNAILSAVRKLGPFVGHALLTHIINKHSKKCLEVGGWSRDDGAHIQQFDYHGGDNQVWGLRRVQESVYAVVSVHSGKSLEVPQGSPEDDQALVQAPYQGLSHQLWLFKKLEDGSFAISAVHSGLNLDVLDGSVEDKAVVVQHHWPEGDRQKWWVHLAKA